MRLDGATELVKKSGVSLSSIVEESVRTADQVRNIATAAEEQSAASEEITHSLDEINRMAGEAAAAMQQSARAVAELVQQSLTLQGLVNGLRQAESKFFLKLSKSRVYLRRRKGGGTPFGNPIRDTIFLDARTYCLFCDSR